MKKPHYKYKRYSVQANRKNSDEKWTEWAVTNNPDDAEKQRQKAEQFGYSARVIDKGEQSIENIVSDIVRDIFAEIAELRDSMYDFGDCVQWDAIAELRSKYLEV